AADVQDAAAQGWGPSERQAVGDRQPGDGDRDPAADAEDPALVVAADGQLVGTRALDVQALADRQLAAGQRDALAVQARVEDDLVAVLRIGDRLAQGPRPAVGVGQDGERAGYDSTFECQQLRHEGRPADRPRTAVRTPAVTAETPFQPARHSGGRHGSVPP